MDWLASFTEHSGTFGNHKATAFDTQSLTVQYFQGSSTMTAYLVPGSPYMTFQYSQATPLLKAMHGGIQTFNGQTLAVGGTGEFPSHLFPGQCSQRHEASATGTQFTVVDTAGTTYRIYSLSSITLTATSVSANAGTISAGGQFTGVLRLVKLAQASHQALLDQHYQVYPTSVGHDYSFTDTTGTLFFNWNTVGDGSQLLMLTWPHHRPKMQNPNFPPTTALGYLTTKVRLSLPRSCDRVLC
jgi:endo-1,3(4)-beta-glucanase